MEGLLIKKVRKHDVLYNPKSTYYRDTDVRQQTWEKIGKELNLKAEEAKSAWDKLRRCFINAHNRRRIKEHESGITMHPWKYEKDMAFLWPFIGKNRSALDYVKPDGATAYENGDSGSEDVGKEIGLENTASHLLDGAENIKLEVDDFQEHNRPATSLSYYGNEEILTPMIQTIMGNKREHSQDDDVADYKRKCMFYKNPLMEMDESDLFFMSMSKMTKSLPVLERAKVKLAVSNAVLQSLISIHGNVNGSSDS